MKPTTVVRPFRTEPAQEVLDDLHERLARTAGERITDFCGVTLTTEPVDRAPRGWAERMYNVRRWTEVARGWHFLVLEEPELRILFLPLRVRGMETRSASWNLPSSRISHGKLRHASR